jgi:hypothetical protein
MLALLRDRMTYANVVATLALFVALGGSSYAALSITSKDVKNRSLKGGDLRKDTVTGTEINEAKLKQVPRARTADTAGAADVSKTSGSAATAGSATTAALADTAKDAQNLAGQGVGAFERSTRTQFGKAPVNPASSNAEQIVLSWPELGVAVTTTAQGPCGGDLGVSFRNTRSSGPSIQALQDGPGDATAAPGGEVNLCSNTDPEIFRGIATDSTGRALFVNCIRANDELRCLGVRSEP